MRFKKQAFSRHKSSIQESSNSKIVKAFGQLLLVLAGGLVGVLGNQFFYERNRKVDISMQIRKEYFESKIPIYNRIVNVTSYYEESSLAKIFSQKTITTKTDPFGLIYGRDTSEIKNTIYFRYPTFLFDSARSNELLNDLKTINDNKDKIDSKVWYDVAELISFFRNNPIPYANKIQVLESSKWYDTLVYQRWQMLNLKLYMSAKIQLDSILNNIK